MVHAIADAVESAGADDVTRVIVLRGIGRDFCSGIDLVASNRRDGAGRPRTGHLQRSFQTGAHRMIEVLDRVQVPVVASVSGWAAGIGNMLALSADVVIAASSSRFWVPFVTKGFTPDSGNTWLLPRLVGLARAKEMMLRGRPIPGEKAAAWWPVSECVPDDQLEASVAAATEELASGATVSVGLAKTLLHRNLESGSPAPCRTKAYTRARHPFRRFQGRHAGLGEKRDPSYRGW